MVDWDTHRIIDMIPSRESNEVCMWLSTYVEGLKKDISAVKCAIIYDYNNGLAEGSVTKIKLIKRIMYGRNSFPLLKAKVLMHEFLYV